ncbi:MAG TPA: cupin domain-containing protein [Bryobacteraceae bacterium]|jgi:quercetin dioxygenase-like cupin family protein|nr:cupin domain-containing protein [Bryobacteraceae bacterium]
MKRFPVFGEPVEILISSKESGGGATTFTQVSPPGGGPPAHSHTNEDEIFYVLEGEYEFLLNGNRRKLASGDAIHASRGSIHTFRNVGTAEGKLLIVTVPGGFEKYLEEISPLSIPQDMERLVEISTRYGISFVI